MSSFIAMDEAGRGSLFGPVSVGAVLITPELVERLNDIQFLQKNPWIRSVDDSKKLSKKKRELLFRQISSFFPVHVAFTSHHYIDEQNINRAVRLGVEKNLRYYKRSFPNTDIRYSLLDGNYRFSFPKDLPDVHSVIKGDARCKSIAIASIMAKVARDNLMAEYDVHYPGYNLKKNAGYGTREHIAQIQNLGPTKRHRLTYLKKYI